MPRAMHHISKSAIYLMRQFLEVVDAVAVPLVAVKFADVFVAGVGSHGPPELSAALLTIKKYG